jgi:hypothetical protein
MEDQGVVNVTYRMPKALHEQLRKFAQEDERSLSGEIIWILKRYVEEREGKATARAELAVA